MPFLNDPIPLTSLTLPAGATSGARIVLDGTTDLIQMFDSSNHLVAQLDPTGMTVANDLTGGFAAANYVRMNIVNALLANPGIEIQPGTSFAGLWDAATLNTQLLGAPGTAHEVQVLSIQSPSFQGDNFTHTSAILMGGPAHDLTTPAGIKIFGDFTTFFNIAGGNLGRFDISRTPSPGDLTIQKGGICINESAVVFNSVQYYNRMGTATLAGGAVTVSNASVTNNTRIFVMCQSPSSVGFYYISARTAGVSFTITSSNVADASTVAWLMIEPS